MTVELVAEQTEAYLRAVVTQAHLQHPGAGFTGLAIEVESGGGPVYVYLHHGEPPPENCEEWKLSYFDEKVEAGLVPAWCEDFENLYTAYAEGESNDYQLVRAYLRIALEGVAQALAGLAQDGFLESRGFTSSPHLSVFNEDDADSGQGAERVRARLE